jgi:UDP-2,4-diacetamido-2,4,6-trideoxy-beta-L-altropyranose hydrolase
MRDHAKAFTPLIESGGHQWRLLHSSERRGEVTHQVPLAHSHWLPVSWQEDAEQTAREIGQLGSVDWLIVDHYALDAGWERVQRAGERRILALDDLADRSHDCDILLDQNVVLGMETRYRTLLPGTCKPLLGPTYALLRPEFAKARKRLVARNGEVRRILVGFGGSDPSNATGKALAAIGSLSGNSPDVDVVIGTSNPHADAVLELCRALPHATLHRGVDNIAELMIRADLAIGAGGVMSWERCCLGLPTIAMDIAANQVGALRALAAAGAIDYPGSVEDVSQERLARSLDAMMSDPARTRAIGERALALVDGEGTDRVRKAMAATGPDAG